MTESRDRLLETATDLFLGKGYGVVGTSEICKAAAVNKGTFYHYFPSKTDLLVAAIERYAERFRAEFVRISASRQDPKDKLTELFEVPARSNRSWHAAHGVTQGCLVGNMALELGSVDPVVRQAVQQAMRSWRFAIEPIVVELIDRGDLPRIDPAIAAEAVIAMIQGGIVVAKSRNDPALVAALAPAALGALSGLAEGPPADAGRLHAGAVTSA